MLYLIDSVLDRKTHKSKPERIGRIVSISNLELDRPAFFNYEDDEGSIGFITSLVDRFEHFHLKSGDKCVIFTENSIYTLKEYDYGNF